LIKRQEGKKARGQKEKAKDFKVKDQNNPFRINPDAPK